MNDDDALMRVYNQELIALSSQAETPHHLDQPSARASAVSVICGSEVMVELGIENDRVTRFGYAVDACALTKSVVAVMKRAILGKTRGDIFQAGESLRAMLDGGAVPIGDWSNLKILSPVVDYKARHDSIMLPFEAVEKAFREVEKSHG